MRLYRKEINRILHSKMVLIFIIIGWIISVLLSIPPVYYMGVRIFDQNGNEQQLTGVSAIQYMKESGKEYDGEVLPDKLNQAMTIYREVTNHTAILEARIFLGIFIIKSCCLSRI